MTKTRLAMVFAAVAVVSGAVGFLASVFGVGSPALLAASPTALGVSLSFFLSRRTRTVALPMFLLGMAAATFAFVSWSAAFHDADAGIPYSPLADSFIPAALTAVVLLAAAIGTATASRLRLGPIRRVLTGVAIGLISVPLVIPLLVTAPVSAVIAVAVVMALSPRGRTLPPDAKPPPSTGRGVRPLALVALAMTVLALGYGLVAGTGLVGTDAATQAMGIMAAGGNLAAVPLMAALTQRSAPGRSWPRIGLIVGGLGVLVSSIGWATSTDLSGGLFLAIPAFVGVWAGTMAGALLPYRGISLIGLSIVIAIGTAVAYFMFALTTAGAALAIISGFVAFGRPVKTKEIRAELAG